jgi:hypothetical protein
METYFVVVSIVCILFMESVITLAVIGGAEVVRHMKYQARERRVERARKAAQRATQTTQGGE